MLENVQAYLSKQGVKYIKPEKAGPHKEEMEDLKALGQAARKEMQTLAKLLEERLAPFKMDRVSNWANQAQICRPHFWPRGLKTVMLTGDNQRVAQAIGDQVGIDQPIRKIVDPLMPIGSRRRAMAKAIGRAVRGRE